MKKKLITTCVFAIVLLFTGNQIAFGLGAGPNQVMLSQNSGFNSEVVHLSIGGEKFAKGVMVKLTMAGQSDIIADQTSRISKTEISCDFDLRDKTAGLWDLTIINPKKFLFFKKERVTVLKEAFSIMEPPAPLIGLISPNRGLNNGPVKIVIQGFHFNKYLALRLVGSNQTSIPVENLDLQSDSSLSGVFNLNQKPLGDYDLEIREGNGRTTVIQQAFRVEAYSRVDELNQKLQSVYFKLNQSIIKADQLPALKDDLTLLESNANLYIALGGHSDERGSRKYNLKLSGKRAAAVKRYLIRQGIDAKRITAYAYGEDFPVTKGDDEADWEKDRRVDILVWETPPTREQGLLKRDQETAFP